MTAFHDEMTNEHIGYCNSCGEEAVLGTECCEDGEVVLYDDDDSDCCFF